MDDILDPPSIARGLSIALCVAGALRVAWDRIGFRHRDLHAKNVMLRPRSPGDRAVRVRFRFRDGSVFEFPAPDEGLPVIIDYGRSHVREMGPLYSKHDTPEYSRDDAIPASAHLNLEWYYRLDIRRWLGAVSSRHRSNRAWTAAITAVDSVVHRKLEDDTAKYGVGGPPRETHPETYGDLLRTTFEALAEIFLQNCTGRSHANERVAESTIEVAS